MPEAVYLIADDLRYGPDYCHCYIAGYYRHGKSGTGSQFRSLGPVFRVGWYATASAGTGNGHKPKRFN